MVLYLHNEYCMIILNEEIIQNAGTSLVAQWLEIHLSMQWTRVRALVWEDPTCHGATETMRHNY